MHKELIARLRAGSGGMKHWQELESEAADAIEALQSEVDQLNDDVSMHMRVAVRSIDDCVELKEERDTLRQQLAEAQAAIEASRKQEPVSFIYGLMGDDDYSSTPVYTTPVVADDAQRDAGPLVLSFESSLPYERNTA
jgi:hypothetical protein